MSRLRPLKSKPPRHIKIRSSTRVPRQPHSGARSVALLQGFLGHFEASVQIRRLTPAFFHLAVPFIHAGKVEDVAQGGGVGSKELYFSGIFESARLVEVLVDEGLHGVDVEEQLC